MKKTVLSAVALAVAFGAGISAAQAETRIGVTIYKYDDNFMSLMRKEIQKDADQLKDVKLLMNDSQNAQSIQNDQVDVLLSKGVKALAINLVDPSAAPTIIGKAKPDNIPVVFSESTISPKPAQQVAKESGAKYGGVLYVDSLSAKKGPVPTYIDLLNVTVSTIVKGFGK